ncbi:HAMP domain-containing histidine kinase [Mucilaginibacter sp. RS28]|uniref:histidine kinase n=1 Tax=Mucilaginibacter straminoryzae TaxID=2932774 RepID=A0A9X1X8E2_9SPHI|nr:HAMP domain-containing sensor histidine kinase [Mucilaginibacter straminoryzae]MCJ8211588.1 HAMP domain-containing histidine kinase [Mucilaginibacter straminoryzae]
MLVQINKDEFAREANKKAWYQTNNIIWTIIFLYPLLGIIDFIYAPDIWIQFLIVRIILVLAILGLYTFFQSRKYDYRILLHIAFMLLSIPSAILCNVVNVQEVTVFFLIYSAIVLFFNLQVYWEPINSVIQVAFAIVLLVIFFNVLNQYSLDLFINNGGQYFFITSIISCLIVSARYKVTERDVRSQLLIEKSNEQLKSQNRDIVEKNNIIDLQYDKLRKLDEQKNSFINIAGHDLKNLIGSVIMSTNGIKEEEYRLSTDQKEFLQYISESAEKMQYMLNMLMEAKEVDSPEIKFNFEIFDINTEARYVFKGLVETAQMKNITLIDNILKLPLNVRLDKVFAGQVFQNLLSNAIKFSQTNNSIKVATSLQRQKFVFEIIDEGIAIGQDELDGMFNKLKTLNDANTTNATGSRLGLGLSIAKLMTQEMGGDLSYRSDVNGNYFRVEFNVIN